jgi:hypothetical protein
MLISFIFFTFLILLFQLFVPINLADFSMPIQHACLSHLSAFQHSAEYQNAICGAKPNSSISIPTFLFFSSSSNLVFLELLLQQGLLKGVRFIDRWAQKEANSPFWTRVVHFSRGHFFHAAITVPVLCLFSACHFFRPNILRALFYVLLKKVNSSWQLQWSTTQIISSSGLFALFFCRSSSSFNILCIGWCACLAATINPKPEPETDPDTRTRPYRNNAWRLKNTIWRFIKIYLLLLPVLMPLGIPHPLTALARFTAYPFLGLAIFILSSAVFLFPYADALTGPLMTFLVFVASQIQAGLPDQAQPQTIDSLYFAIYLFGLTLWAQNLEQPKLCREYF